MVRGSKSKGDSMIAPHSKMRLLELFSEKMSIKEFRDMNQALLVSFGESFGESYYDRIDSEYFKLGGTPLNDAILLARQMLRDFQKATRTQIVSAIFLTDGESGGCFSTKNSYCMHLNHYDVLIDPIRKKYYRNPPNGRSLSLTSHLIRVLREDGFTTVCFRVISKANAASTVRYAIEEDSPPSWGRYRTRPEGKVAQVLQELRQNGAVSVDNVDGFDQYNWITYKTEAKSEDGKEDEFSFDVKDNATKGQITRAFIKARSDRLNTRSVIKRFAERVAK